LCSSLTDLDIEDVIESLSQRVLLKSTKEIHWYRATDIKTSLEINPREQHVLVHAWRVISERFAPVKLDWAAGSRGSYYNIVLHAQRTEWPLTLDTFEAYAQGRASPCRRDG
jgi:hypothetical protein